MKILILKPKPGRRVLDPAQTPPRPLPPEGAKVVDSPYWRSRIKEGVVEVGALPGAGPLDPNPAGTEQAPADKAEPEKSERKEAATPPAAGKKKEV